MLQTRFNLIESTEKKQPKRENDPEWKITANNNNNDDGKQYFSSIVRYLLFLSSLLPWINIISFTCLGF